MASSVATGKSYRSAITWKCIRSAARTSFLLTVFRLLLNSGCGCSRTSTQVMNLVCESYHYASDDYDYRFCNRFIVHKCLLYLFIVLLIRDLKTSAHTVSFFLSFLPSHFTGKNNQNNIIEMNSNPQGLILTAQEMIVYSSITDWFNARFKHWEENELKTILQRVIQRNSTPLGKPLWLEHMLREPVGDYLLPCRHLLATGPRDSRGNLLFPVCIYHCHMIIHYTEYRV